MKTETHVTWEERNERSIGLSVQTRDWRLECNAQAIDLDCQELPGICSKDTLIQIMRQAISLHVPTLEAALQSANPPDQQLKKKQTGHL